MRKAGIVFVFIAIVLAAGCASRKDSGLGMRVLDCVVVEREHEAPGTGGASYAGTGNYYLVFETREGQATARYRLSVTRAQWIRFPEGSHVRISLSNNILTDIRSSD